MSGGNGMPRTPGEGGSLDQSNCYGGGRVSSLDPAMASLRDAAMPKPMGNVASSSEDRAASAGGVHDHPMADEG